MQQFVFGKSKRPLDVPKTTEEAALDKITHLVMDIRCARRDGDVELVREYQRALTTARAEFVTIFGYEAP